ncbi:MAG: site-specific DNA-methyltransferase [Staphylococcus sp.]|nr:site-specific DNA-methyltransferase [Staphylococcus sp.]
MILFNGDCLKVMDELINNGVKVDAVITDPPYGTTKNKWDSVIPFDKMWKCLLKLSNDKTPIILFGNQPFTSLLVVSNLKMFRYSLVWVKNKFSDFLNAKRKPMKTNEEILLFYKKQPIYNPQYSYSTPYKRWNTQDAVDKQTNYGKHKKNVSESNGKRLPTTVLNFNRVERPIHPTQKPVELLEYLIKTYTNEGDTILDFTMGSGTTGVACKNLNRNFIGIELDKKYFEIAKERLKEANPDIVEML